jgi:hypothetical protein
MEAKSTTYDKNRLITFGEYKTFFTRGSDSNFVDDTKDMFNYDNIELVKDLPNFNKVICTNDILNPEKFNVDDYTLPTNTTKCLRNIDIDNIISLKYDIIYDINITQDDNITYFIIVSIKNIEQNEDYDSGKECVLRLRAELDGDPYDLNLKYGKFYDVNGYRQYYYWTKVNKKIKDIKFTGVSWLRNTDKTTNFSSLLINIPFVLVYIGRVVDTNTPVVNWISNIGTQCEGLIEYMGMCENTTPTNSGGGESGGGGGEDDPPTDALIVQDGWVNTSWLIQHEYNSPAIIYGKLVVKTIVESSGVNHSYHLITPNNTELNLSTKLYFEFKPTPTLNQFYAFNARYTGADTGISISSIKEGGYDYLYDNGITYDNNFTIK